MSRSVETGSASPAGAGPAKPAAKGWSALKKAGILLVAAPVLLFAAYTWVTLHWSYSRGSRETTPYCR